MITLFENQMDLFTKLERADITDWMHVKTKSWVSQQNELYKFKPPIKVSGYKSDFDKLRVSIYFYTSYIYIAFTLTNETESTAINAIHGKHSIRINLSIYNYEDTIKRAIDSMTDVLEWNEYINFPPNLIDDIVTRVKEIIPSAEDIT